MTSFAGAFFTGAFFVSAAGSAFFAGAFFAGAFFSSAAGSVSFFVGAFFAGAFAVSAGFFAGSAFLETGFLDASVFFFSEAGATGFVNFFSVGDDFFSARSAFLTSSFTAGTVLASTFAPFFAGETDFSATFAEDFSFLPLTFGLLSVLLIPDIALLLLFTVYRITMNRCV
ncbi:MAG: hypothetical protein SPK75_11160 [Victivallales bacterium]|nr:hypothetical protein [bacterium]MDY5696923.1 hypothetical protein [Victivallales bacterium]